MGAMVDINQLMTTSFVPKSDEDWGFIRLAAQNLFKPKKPIDDDKLFAGRVDQINQLLDAVYEEGGHAILFGERGVGKTSLAKIIEGKVAPILTSVRVPEPISCGTNDDFWTLWGNAFNNFSASDMRPVEYFRKHKNPYEVYNAISDLDQSVYHIIIFDEFDRIKDDETLRLMAELLKHFSNNSTNTTIVIVGVADTLRGLFREHESIARCCEQVRMQRMSSSELSEIIEDRLPRINFSIDPAVSAQIVRLSQGLPGYVHLLGKLSLLSAIDRRSTRIEARDLSSALAEALQKADQETRTDYLTATQSSAADHKYREVLLACALAKSNELGYFFAGSLREPYSKIRGRPMDIANYSTNLNNLCKADRGPAIIKTGQKKNYQYRFANPLLQPLTVMLGVRDGLVSDF